MNWLIASQDNIFMQFKDNIFMQFKDGICDHYIARLRSWSTLAIINLSDQSTSTCKGKLLTQAQEAKYQYIVVFLTPAWNQATNITQSLQWPTKSA